MIRKSMSKRRIIEILKENTSEFFDVSIAYRLDGRPQLILTLIIKNEDIHKIEGK